MTVKFDDIKAFAYEQFELAKTGSEAIKLSLNAETISRNEMVTERYGAFSAKALGDNPDFSSLEMGYGKSVWAVVLAVDLRRSTNREIRIGPKKTHLTMHTYLPTMINLVGQWNGSVVGLRGDGLIAQFGETEIIKNDNTDVDPKTATKAAKQAVRCGKSMIETIDEIINPLLEQNDIESGLAVGVGIHHSNLVVTRIGHLTASELTAYGPAVNKASKFSDRTNQIHLTAAVRDLYPKVKGGRVGFRPVGGGNSGLVVDFPSDMHMLERKARRDAG